jgi:hypothetical protein
MEGHPFDRLYRLLDVRHLDRRHILKDIKLEFRRARTNNLRRLVAARLSDLGCRVKLVLIRLGA